MTAQGSKAFVLLNRDAQDLAQVDVRDEHVHDADEVFAVISGRAQVGLRVGEWVYSVLCEKAINCTCRLARGAGWSWVRRRSAWPCVCMARAGRAGEVYRGCECAGISGH